MSLIKIVSAKNALKTRLQIACFHTNMHFRQDNKLPVFILIYYLIIFTYLFLPFLVSIFCISLTTLLISPSSRKSPVKKIITTNLAELRRGVSHRCSKVILPTDKQQLSLKEWKDNKE